MLDQTPALGSAQVLLDIIQAQSRGQAVGITSVCSANEFVLRAALSLAKRRGYALLVESTCNQVNQHGGYTGLTPARFRDFLLQLASEAGLPAGQLLLGGDHLGPHVWRDRPAMEAMSRACQLVRDCVRAGYRKIHLDSSMHCADDDHTRPLPLEVSAARAAQLAQVAETADDSMRVPLHMPHYVIGTEVPTPGGGQSREHGFLVSSPDAVEQVIEVSQRAFLELGLASAWERVLALVVQPGVEFGNADVHHFDPQAAQPLVRQIEQHPGLVYEVHSTDYQRRDALRRLVRDHFAILKVGPALTYALRGTLLGLERIEVTLRGPGWTPSNLARELEVAMRANPKHWQAYYAFDLAKGSLVQRDGYSDRSRYYWTVPSVQAAVDRLLANLGSRTIPQDLLRAFLSELYPRVEDGSVNREAPALITAAIQRVLDDYDFACGRMTSPAMKDPGASSV